MKKFFYMALTVATLLCLSACGKDDTSGSYGDGQPIQTVPPVVMQEEDNSVVGERVPVLIEDAIDPDEDGDYTEAPNFDDEEVSDDGNESGVIDDIFGNSSDEGSEDGEGENEGDEEEVVDETSLHKLDTTAGEKAISDGKFDDGVATEQAIRDMLHVNGAQVSYEVVSSAVTMVNSYSKEGFLRMIEDAERVDVHTQNAAVLVCKILNLKYDQLWESGFMDENVANIIIDVLDQAEEAWKLENK